MSKVDLCLQFAGMTEEDDDLLLIVEQLLENQEVIECLYPSKKPCARKSTTQFGYCTRHSLTKKGKALTALWESAISEIDAPDAPESDEESPEETPVPEETPHDFDIRSPTPKPDPTPAPTPKPDPTPAPTPNPAPPSPDHEDSEEVAEYVPPEDTSDAHDESGYNDDGVKHVGPGKYELALRKNKFGQYVHTKSGLVFNTSTGHALGTVAPEGRMYALMENDIEFCRKYNVKFKIPR